MPIQFDAFNLQEVLAQSAVEVCLGNTFEVLFFCLFVSPSNKLELLVDKLRRLLDFDYLLHTQVHLLDCLFDLFLLFL